MIPHSAITGTEEVRYCKTGAGPLNTFHLIPDLGIQGWVINHDVLETEDLQEINLRHFACVLSIS